MKKVLVALLAVIVLISGVIIYKNISQPACVPASTEVSPEPVIKDISLLVLGDNLLHNTVAASGRQSDGSYDYTEIFKNVQPEIENADISVIGQETILGGTELGISGYPLFNSPQEVGLTLINEGFDVVLHASNHVLDKGCRGIQNTLDFWNDHPEMIYLGINKDENEQSEIKIIEREGVKFALLNYTYGTNGIPIPLDRPYLVDCIDKEKIKKDIEKANEISDCVIAFMHWGTEYATKPNDEQKELSQMMADLGVDLIVGAHPHVLEPAEWYTGKDGNKMLVYYSLGNFVSHQHDLINLIGGMAKVNFKYDGEKVWIDDASLIPHVTYFTSSFSLFTVYPLKDYTEDLSSKNALSMYSSKTDISSFKTIVDDIFEGYDAVKIDY